MHLTNKFNLPQPWLDAASYSNYQRGDADFTASELPLPERILSLRRSHKDEISEDASNCMWRLASSAKHVILQYAAQKNPDRYIVEHRFEGIMPGGTKISGRIDLYDKEDHFLYDYKEISVFAFLMEKSHDDWNAQANVNRLLMAMNGIQVKGLKILAMLRDWRPREARFRKKPDYPACPVHVVELPMWAAGETQAYILERVKKHRLAAQDPPVCTKKERWQLDACWAVMRRDRKNAIPGGLCDSKDKAHAVMMHEMKRARPGDTGKYYIEKRNMEPRRCLDYCEVQTWCDFGTAAEKEWEKKHVGADE